MIIFVLPTLRKFHFAGAVILMLALLGARSTPGQQVSVVPETTDEILANPGMGWETFQRTAARDKNLPAWIPSTIHYTRWGWNVLEPEPGKLNEALLDKALKETHDAGQRLAFRVECCATKKGQPYHPAWLEKVGGRILITNHNGVSPLPIPDMDDPVVLGRHLDFIKRLGARYDGHPDLDHVDLGSIGWWGEWHLSGSKNCKLPTLENRMKVVEAYFAAFKKTPLLMLIGGKECLVEATRRGAGWRADCLGDLGGFTPRWCHMRQGYPQMIAAGHIEEVWKTAPVAWESGWDMRKWVAQGWPLRYIFNYGLACHASYLNNKSAPLPTGDDVRPEVERFLRRLGYRLELKEWRHAGQVHAGGKLELAMQWRNTGSAPCYRPYRLAYRLTDDKGTRRTVISPITVNHWLPGTVKLFTEEFLKTPPDLPPGEIASVKDTIAIPEDLAAGVYTVAVGVVDGEAAKPVVRLGIKGRDEEGWYPLSKVRVVR